MALFLRFFFSVSSIYHPSSHMEYSFIKQRIFFLLLALLLLLLKCSMLPLDFAKSFYDGHRQKHPKCSTILAEPVMKFTQNSRVFVWLTQHLNRCRVMPKVRAAQLIEIKPKSRYSFSVIIKSQRLQFIYINKNKYMHTLNMKKLGIVILQLFCNIIFNFLFYIEILQ